MFSLDSVLDDLWPQARPAPWQKSLLKRLLHEDEFQQFAASHRHLKGLDMVEQVLEHLDILCTIFSNCLFLSQPNSTNGRMTKDHSSYICVIKLSINFIIEKSL